MNVQELWADYENPTNSEKMSMVRMHRDNLLKESDWSQLPDAPLTVEEKELWVIYRDELRNLPQEYPKADDIVFPTKP